MARMIFAKQIDTGKIVSVDEVEKGLACNCVCPNCGARLEARKGKVRAHHFKHYDKDETSFCSESALHLAAKEILKEAGEIALPELKIEMSSRINDLEILPRGYIFKYNVVEDEVAIKVDNELMIRPDVLLRNGKAALAVEIFVTHRIDEDKYFKIKKAKLSTVEIDLSTIEIHSRIELEELILRNIQQKYWIYSEKQELLRKYCEERVVEFKIQKRSKVNECPLKIWRGIMVGCYTGDCYDCKYCYSIDGEKVLCLGNDRIATIEELVLKEKDLQKHKNKVKDIEIKEDRKLIESGFCPAHQHSYYILETINTQISCVGYYECGFYAQIDAKKDIIRYKNRKGIWDVIKLTELSKKQKIRI